MKSNKRLATLSLIIMALVSTPRAVQQLSHSIDAAQERAGLVWWNLLLTPDAQAAENTVAQKTSPCTESINTRLAQASNSTMAKNNAAPAAARRKVDARTAQRQASSDSIVGPELAANNSSREGMIDPAAWSDDDAALSKQDAAQRDTLQKLASHAAPQTMSSAWRPAKLQSALAALDGHDAPAAPPYLRIVGSDIDTSEFPSRPAMDALIGALAKKGINVQFRMRKALDKNQLPRPRARMLIGKDAMPLPTATRCECPVG